ncbi:molybdopterin-synthase adenylyltransferase MoeB [Roseomonas sp. KE0001]|uniref:molybdopterin-synthase adenylyltransferase MoeB n=1 Tax=Roseomonas sp. KE0001 TaxID=2479201 RepID=UPI0018DF066F|nr:molybdopterin-synthase adenylyltransferase MoeB [Roseomonas sp. KE0001]MBI0435232.1 molybdopterin-synthase adenylyltransferase MoeB [Roseomonas sp. KE0001]
MSARLTDPALPELGAAELRRFSRHLILPEFGLEAQRRLKAGSALLIGAGGLGSPTALYLAAAGVGRIGLVDPDVVEETNLQRQVAHGHSTLGRPKTESAAARMRDLNPDVVIERHDVFLNVGNALDLIAGYDVVIDGTDNFPTRYLVNDACVKLGKPNVYGGVLRFDGQLSVFDARRGPCYRCLFPEPPPSELAPNCAEAGVLGVLPGVIGALQATEAIKLLTGIGQPMIGRMLVYDGLDLSFTSVDIARAPACPCCSGPRDEIELRETVMVCSAPQVGRSIEADALQARLAGGEALTLVDVRNPSEWLGGTIPQALCLSKPALTEAVDLVLSGGLRPENTLLDALPRDREIVLYCQSGLRSAAVIRSLTAAGYDPSLLYNLEKGFAGWTGPRAEPGEARPRQPAPAD